MGKHGADALFLDDSLSTAFCTEIYLDNIPLTFVWGERLLGFAEVSGQIAIEDSSVGIDKEAAYIEKTVQVVAGDNLFSALYIAKN